MLLRCRMYNLKRRTEEKCCHKNRVSDVVQHHKIWENYHAEFVTVSGLAQVSIAVFLMWEAPEWTGMGCTWGLWRIFNLCSFHWCVWSAVWPILLILARIFNSNQLSKLSFINSLSLFDIYVTMKCEVLKLSVIVVYFQVAFMKLFSSWSLVGPPWRVSGIVYSWLQLSLLYFGLFRWLCLWHGLGMFVHIFISHILVVLSLNH